MRARRVQISNNIKTHLIRKKKKCLLEWESLEWQCCVACVAFAHARSCSDFFFSFFFNSLRSWSNTFPRSMQAMTGGFRTPDNWITASMLTETITGSEATATFRLRSSLAWPNCWLLFPLPPSRRLDRQREKGLRGGRNHDRKMVFPYQLQHHKAVIG